MDGEPSCQVWLKQQVDDVWQFFSTWSNGRERARTTWLGRQSGEASEERIKMKVTGDGTFKVTVDLVPCLCGVQRLIVWGVV